MKVQGYAFQVALLFEALIHKAKIKEIPVEFVDRIHGESKLGMSDIIEFIINAWWLRFRASATFLKFLITGASGVIVNLGMFTALLYFGVNKYIASPIAIETSILSNFALNNGWTFRSRQTKDTLQIRGLKFNFVSLLALSLSYSTFVFLSFMFPTWPPQLNQFIGIMPATLVNYFLNSYWTFKNMEEL
nr:GtrA family protein [Methylomarinum sp. Ch1-1]MDP4519860.1 GtrA family protein [Methylomarinum sp. Ch1-1]